jgi:hypothetical protein
VHDRIETVRPALAQRSEHTADLCIVGDVARQDEIDAEAFRQRAYALLDRLIRVGQRQLRPGGPKPLGNRPRNAVIVGDAEDRRALAGHRCSGSGNGLFSPQRTERTERKTQRRRCETRAAAVSVAV